MENQLKIPIFNSYVTNYQRVPMDLPMDWEIIREKI